MKLWFLKIQNRFFFGQNFFGQNITYSASSCSKPVCFFLLLNTNEDICKNLIKLLMIATDLHSICFHTKLMPAINCCYQHSSKYLYLYIIIKIDMPTFNVILQLLKDINWWQYVTYEHSIVVIMWVIYVQNKWNMKCLLWQPSAMRKSVSIFSVLSVGYIFTLLQKLFCYKVFCCARFTTMLLGCCG